MLFTDIEGSTRLIDELGEETYVRALGEHRRVLRVAFSGHGGVEVDTQGDALFYVFADPTEALAAADQGQEALAPGEVKVRMGLHTGELLLTSEGYAGRELHRAARIAAVGHGGQVVLSAATRELVDGELTDLGEHRLKDFAEPVWLFQLGQGRFPPLKTISNTNLPWPASSFVGREQEVAEVVELLQEGARLVTLSGPGGSGKTRLAIKSAAELVAQFRNGVFWIGLAALRDPALVTETIAQTLGAKDGLAEHVGERELLLLLDNFEHVVDAAPELSSLLESCPNLRLLVTSRELLRVRGEVGYPVPPLQHPDAVELFCARSGLQPSDEIAELCARLDDLPLAVELAAARVSVLSPAQILARLSQRLDLLKGGRDTEARQQTLRATIEWSYDLLDERERRFFARLSIFAGGCTLEAAESIAGADLDTLQALVDKSLLRHTNERFWMLETIRELAIEHLAESGDADDLLGTEHTTYFLELAELAKPELDAASSSIWFDRLEAEHDNLRAALADTLEHGRADLALRLGHAVHTFWFARGYWGEGRRWLASALASTTDPHLRAAALPGAGVLAIWQGDVESGRAVSEELLALAEEIGSTRARADGLLIAGIVTDDPDEEVQLDTEGGAARARAVATGRWSATARTTSATSSSAAATTSARSVSLKKAWRPAGNLNNQDLIARASTNLGLTTLLLGDIEGARLPLRDGLNAARKLGQIDGLVYGFVGLAATYAREDPLLATRLLGRADAMCEETAYNLEPLESGVRDQTRAQLQAHLGEDGYAAGCEEGRALTLQDALALILRPD